MRKAELIMAIILAIFSAFLMYESAKVPIGWVKGVGPGAGMFPFWLSSGMFICCFWIIFNWIKRTSPPSQSEEPYFDPETKNYILIVCVAIIAMVGAIHFVGIYGSVPIFMAWYMRFLGDHSWTQTVILSVATTIITFFFFEILLHITLPKGWLEPLFYPLYDMFM